MSLWVLFNHIVYIISFPSLLWKESQMRLKDNYSLNLIFISDVFFFFFWCVFQRLFGCHFVMVVAMNKKYVGILGVHIYCGDGAKWFPLLSVRVMSSCYFILSKILDLHSVFENTNPRHITYLRLPCVVSLSSFQNHMLIIMSEDWITAIGPIHNTWTQSQMPLKTRKFWWQKYYCLNNYEDRYFA